MLTNQTFLDSILESFNAFVESGTSRSTKKLKPLHGAIAKDIAKRLGDKYLVKSQGYGDDKEVSIAGRYIDKMVDITILDKQTEKAVAGIAVKFVMQNYSQNSNNYFENMLGETANIRTADCLYFQIFIIFDKLPYYKNTGELSKWEDFTGHNILKYCRLSNDNVDCYYHTPNKTLIFVVHTLPDASTTNSVKTKTEYLKFYSQKTPKMRISSNKYTNIKQGGTVILNDYEKFIDKVYHSILAK